jgi:hypothetical protein
MQFQGIGKRHNVRCIEDAACSKPQSFRLILQENLYKKFQSTHYHHGQNITSVM